MQSQRATGATEPQPKGDGRDSQDRRRLGCPESVENGQGQRFLMYVGQPSPGARDVYLARYEIRVDTGHGAGPDVGQSYRECTLPFRSAVHVEDDSTGDAEEPGPRVVSPRGQVVEASPGDEKGFRDHILGVIGMYPALREPEQIGVRRFEERGETRLAVRSPGLVAHAHYMSTTRSSVSPGRQPGATATSPP